MKLSYSLAAVAAALASLTPTHAGITPYIAERLCDENDPPGRFTSNASVIHVGLMSTPFTGFLAQFVLNVFDLAQLCALERINEDPSLLPDTRLEPVFIDPQGTQAGGATAAICMHRHEIPVAVGPFTSPMALGAATIGSIYKLNIVASTPNSPLLSNKDPEVGFPYFARLVAPTAGAAVAQLMKQMGFRRASTLSTTPDAYADSTVASFVDEAQRIGLEVARAQTIAAGASVTATVAEVDRALELLRDTGSRVVFVVLSQASRQTVLERAHALNMLGDGWAWFVPQGTAQTLASSYSNITQGFLGVEPVLDQNLPEYQHYETCMRSRGSPENATGPFANLTMIEAPLSTLVGPYDALLTIAHAIHALGAENVMDPVALREAIFNASFEGAMGRIQFDENGDRTGFMLDVVQVRGEGVVSVGTLDTETSTLTVQGDVFWPGNNTARPQEFIKDCDVDTDFNKTISSCAPLRSVVYGFANEESERYCTLPPPLEIDCSYATLEDSGAGLALAGAALVFTAALGVGLGLTWNHQVIRMSQRRFLAIVLLGSLVLNATPLVTVGEISEAKCFALPTMVTIGTVLLFGPLFIKSWRVQKLLSNKKLKKLKITDAQLFRMLGALLAVDALLLIVMSVTEPLRVVETLQTTEGGRLQVPFEECAAETTNIASVLYFFHAALFGYGLYISYTIRHVTEALSEAKWIFVAVYNGSLCGLATMGIVQGLQVNAAQRFLVVSVGLSVTTAVTCALIFVPKFLLIRSKVAIHSTSNGATTQRGTNFAATVAASSVVGSGEA